MRGATTILIVTLGACGGGGATDDAGSDATADGGTDGDATTQSHGACNFTVEGAEQADGSCQFAMLYHFGLNADDLRLSNGEGGVPGSFLVVLAPRDGGAFLPGSYSTSDFSNLTQGLIYYGVKDSTYTGQVGSQADSSVTLQITSVDPYPTDKNLYGLPLPAPSTHGSFRAVLIGGPLVEDDAGVILPQDGSVTLSASF